MKKLSTPVFKRQDIQYFEQLNQTLINEGHGMPRLLVDLDRLDHNLNQLKQHWPEGIDFRLVVKSLPCIELIRYITSQLDTSKFMAFHLPFLCQISHEFPDSDILIGKPFPIAAVEHFYNHMALEASSFDSETQLHWLVDTPQRLTQYLNFAQKSGMPLSINIELDIGLHRGGVDKETTLDVMLTAIRNHPKWLKFSGFMGYDAHVGKLPGWLESTSQSYQASQDRYQVFIDYARRYFSDLITEDTLYNGAGSPTIELHKQNTVCNDLSAGSALVKPSHFDLPLLSGYQPASFIASPIIKQLDRMKLPAPDWISRVLQRLDRRFQQTFFVYGGDWKADLIDHRLRKNPLYGSSANQEIINGSKQVMLTPDDHIFWRPQQSEAVFLQFGDIYAIRNKQLAHRWQVLDQAF